MEAESISHFFQMTSNMLSGHKITLEKKKVSYYVHSFFTAVKCVQFDHRWKRTWSNENMLLAGNFDNIMYTTYYKWLYYEENFRKNLVTFWMVRVNMLGCIIRTENSSRTEKSQKISMLKLEGSYESFMSGSAKYTYS